MAGTLTRSAVSEARSRAISELFTRYQGLLVEDTDIRDALGRPGPRVRDSQYPITVVANRDSETQAARMEFEAFLRVAIGRLLYEDDVVKATELRDRLPVSVVEASLDDGEDCMASYLAEHSLGADSKRREGGSIIAFANRYSPKHVISLAKTVSMLVDGGVVDTDFRLPYVSLFDPSDKPVYRRVGARTEP